MESNDLDVLAGSRLFAGIDRVDLEAMLGCLSAHRRTYRRDEIILHAGDRAKSLGMVISGSVDVFQEDYWGNRNIMTTIMPGQAFAESYVFEGRPLDVSVRACSDATILWLDTAKLLTTCSSACGFHARLISNLVSLLSSKNLLLNQKLTHLTQRTTREKLLSYLSAQAMKGGRASFEIPFNRQQLADYLSVDRSAMCSELSRMQKEGILDYERNRFSLHLQRS